MKGLPKQFLFFHGSNFRIYSVGNEERLHKRQDYAIQVTTNPSLKDMLEYNLYLKHKL